MRERKRDFLKFLLIFLNNIYYKDKANILNVQINLLNWVNR